jgi:hypothetical protein
MLFIKKKKSFIEPNVKGYTIPRFVNIDECAINEPNVTLEL